MQIGFSGFAPEALAFFRGLERNNRREWFQARKETFDTKVRGPMLELVAALNQELARLAPDYIVEPEKAVYRIYRDTRFSSDKTPYKTHIAATFPCRGLEKHAGAGMYFSVNHKEIEVAGGVYMPGPDQLLAIRTYLSEHHEEFRRIMANRTLRRLVGDLQGEQLSRVPKGFQCDHPAADLVRYKQWLVYIGLEPAIATTPRLFAEVLKRFEAMLPMVEFLNAPLKASRGKAALTFYA